MLSTLPEELLPILMEEALQKVADAGGTNAWAMLSEKEKADREAVVYQKICFRFGQVAYDALTEKEKKRGRFLHLGGLLHAQGAQLCERR